MFMADLDRAGLINESGSIVHQALCTCPGDTATFTDKPLDSEQAKIWLQDVLISAGMGVSYCRSLGTHSMKATTLSWCAKFGLSARTRKFLGYHVDRSDTSLAIYSRDLASKPLRQLCKVIHAVANRSFFPDATRSGYFKRRHSAEVVEGPNGVPLEQLWYDTEVVEEVDVLFPEEIGDHDSSYSRIPPIPPLCDDLAVNFETHIEDDKFGSEPCETHVDVTHNPEHSVDAEDKAESESSFSNSSSSSGESNGGEILESFEANVSNVAPRNPARSSTDVVYQHSRLGTLHLTHAVEVSRLACGRALSLAYKPVHSV